MKFKSPEGVIVEVTEEFANQVLIPQGKYKLVVEEKPVKVETHKVSKKKAKKKVK